MTIDLTDQEIKDLAVLLDAAVKTMGIQAVKAAHPILVKLDAAYEAKDKPKKPAK